MIKLLLVIAAFGLFVYPYILNILKLVSCDWVITAEEVLRVVGIFVAPLGWVLGFVGHF